METQDRPEIHRLIKSIKKQNGFDLIVLQDNIIIGSTRSMSEVEKAFNAPLGKWALTRADEGLFLEIKESVSREDSPNINSELISFVTLYRPIITSLIVGVLTFIFVMALGALNRKLIRSGIRKALCPLEELSGAIRKLAHATVIPALNPLAIRELDTIREAVTATYVELIEARDRLTRVQSKEIAADGYRRLIHDLATPISTLSKLVKAAERHPDDPHVIEQVKTLIPKLIDQILGQLSAASKTLEFEEPRFSVGDLRLPIQDAKEQIDAFTIDKRTPPKFELLFLKKPSIIFTTKCF